MMLHATLSRSGHTLRYHIAQDDAGAWSLVTQADERRPTVSPIASERDARELAETLRGQIRDRVLDGWNIAETERGS